MSPRRPLQLAGDGLEVPVLDGRMVPYAHLDYAASAPAWSPSKTLSPTP